MPTSTSPCSSSTIADVKLLKSFNSVSQILRHDAGVVVLRDPRESVKGTYVDTDAAVHAQAPVDGEPIKHGNAAWAPRYRLGHLDGVALDLDTPVGALADTDHA